MGNSLKYEISKKFSFSASHTLSNLPPEHPCSRLHGHNYTVTVVLGGRSLNNAGMLFDYRGLDNFKKTVDLFDHRHLNDVISFIPTAENLAQHLFELAARAIESIDRSVLVMTVSVSETDKTSATYYRP